MSCTGMPTRAVFIGWILIAALAVGIAAGPWWARDTYAASAGPETTGPAASQQQEAENSDPEANLPYLFAVYMVTWGVFFAYVFFTSRRQREMRRELDVLKATLEEKDRLSGGREQEPSEP